MYCAQFPISLGAKKRSSNLMKREPSPSGCAHRQPSSKGDVFSSTAPESLLVGISGARISRSPGQPSFIEAGMKQVQ